MELFDGYNNLATDFFWTARVNQAVYGKDKIFVAKFNNPIVAVLADTTNINRSNIAGYLTQMATTPLGLAEVGNRLRLPNKTLRVFILPELLNYQVRFTLAFPVGNCKVQVWEAIPK